jgi:hypothetical protein
MTNPWVVDVRLLMFFAFVSLFGDDLCARIMQDCIGCINEQANTYASALLIGLEEQLGTNELSLTNDNSLYSLDPTAIPFGNDVRRTLRSWWSSGRMENHVFGDERL